MPSNIGYIFDVSIKCKMVINELMRLTYPPFNREMRMYGIRFDKMNITNKYQGVWSICRSDLPFGVEGCIASLARVMKLRAKKNCKKGGYEELLSCLTRSII